jgi:hypothetical protein
MMNFGLEWTTDRVRVRAILWFPSAESGGGGMYFIGDIAGPIIVVEVKL